MNRSDQRGVPGVDQRVSLLHLAESCQLALEQDRQNAQALVGIALVALASGQVEAGVRVAQGAVAASPERGATWVALGQALRAAGRTEEAADAYEAALRLDGMDALAHTGLGELWAGMGRAEEALKEFELGLRREPAMTAAMVGKGHALALLGRNEDALASYEQALALDGCLAEAEFAAGFLLARGGRLESAEQRYRRAIWLRPDFAAAWMNLGCLLRELPNVADEYAEAALTRAVELCPAMLTGWLNRALLKRETGRLAEAEADLRRALDLDAEHVETLVEWSRLCLARNDVEGAWDWVRKSLAVKGDHAEAVNMQGILLHIEQRFEEAVKVFARAEQLGSKAAASNRGNSLMDLGRVEEAIVAHEAALKSDRRNAGSEYNLALARLRTGDWKRGWQEYEARWRFREVHRAPVAFRVPRWRGEALEGRRILLHAEQGLGDAIQFCRYANVVAARGGRVVLQVHARLTSLMNSLAAVGTGQAEVARLGENPPEFEVECPLMSLPAVLGTTPETVPWAGAYLSAEPGMVLERLRAFPRVARKMRVGIAWAGNARYKGDAQRSTQLTSYLPLLRAVDAEWFSLQKGEATSQLAALPGDVSVADGCSADKSLAETAALVALLDVVVTTDTCIAHLAGAMGKPVWILLPLRADWRWMLATERTPWYPTARLHRQSEAGGWAGLMKRVAEGLRVLESML